MTEQNIRLIEQTIGYHFKNPALLRQAFTRASYTNEMMQARTPADTDSNEVLEFIGDSVLSCALVAILSDRYGKLGERGLESSLGEGELSIIKSNLCDKRALSARISELGLAEYMRVSRGDITNHTLAADSPREDLFESIIGAVALDCGMDFRILIPLIERLDDPARLTVKTKVNKDPKTLVKEYCEAHAIPYRFELTSESGPDHAKQYTVCLFIREERIAEGTARSKKLADREAAHAALSKLGL